MVNRFITADLDLALPPGHIGGRMLKYLTLILCCQLVGEVAAVALHLPVPGPVIGMACLFAILLLRGGVPAGLGQVADGILNNMGLLFVPAGVGVLLHMGLLGADWLAVSVALILGTLLTIVVTAWVMLWLGGRRD